jgi:hypothetical protein
VTAKKPSPRGARTASGPTPNHAIGYWVDSRVPDLADLLVPHGIDPAEFAAWLRSPLERYRGATEVTAQWPTIGDERKTLRAYGAILDRAAQTLLPDAIPPRSAAGLKLLSLRAGVNWSTLCEGVLRDLETLSALMRSVEGDMGALPAKRGRKTLAQRDPLLSEIVDLLRSCGCKAIVANHIAEKILTRCGVPVPTQIESIERAARRSHQRKK